MLFSMKHSRYSVSVLSLILSIATAAASVFLFVQYKKFYYSHWERAKKEAIDDTRDAANELFNYVAVLKDTAESIAAEISKNNLNEQQIEELLQKKKVDKITEVAVAFLPYAFDKSKKLFGRVIAEKDGKVEKINLEDVYDYTDKEHTWFNQPIKNGAGFLQPYHGSAVDTILAEYAAPIYKTNDKGEKKVIGVAIAGQSIEHLQHVIEALFLGNKGYWFVLTETGSFLAYPQLKYQSKTIFDIAKDLNNPALAEEANKIMKGESVVFSYNNEITKAPSWLVSSRISNTPWSVVGVFDQGEFYYDSNLFRHKLILPSIMFMLSVIFFSLFLAYRHKATVSLWGFLSTLISISILLQIIWMWYAIYNYPYKLDESNIYRIENKLKLFEYLEKNFPPLEDEPEVEKQYQDLSLKERLLRVAPYKQFIPTGIYINSLQLSSETSEIKLSAYFWQRLTMGLHDQVPPGFVFIQTNDATITEETAVTHNRDKLITYDVFARLNQFLTYTLYPFDMKSLRIKYWSKTSPETFYFIPDLTSYQLINPRSLPGIDPDIYIPGWELIGSYFGYQKLPYTTNFGAYFVGPFGTYEEDDLSVEPQPFFEIIIRRNLLDALVSDLIPIAVIAVLLFLVVLTLPNDRFLTTIASIFFATIFAHIRFRSKIPQSQIVYLENLYFILYVVMLVLLIACFLVQNKVKIRFITNHDNLLLKVMYWPMLLGSFAIISLFYLW